MKKPILFVAVGLIAIWGAEGKLAPPKIEDYTYVCQKCGKTTHYPASELEPRSFIEECRKGCATLRELGLDAALDESVLCRHCVGAASLQHKHKYRVYRQQQPLNPVNPVNPV